MRSLAAKALSSHGSERRFESFRIHGAYGVLVRATSCGCARWVVVPEVRVRSPVGTPNIYTPLRRGGTVAVMTGLTPEESFRHSVAHEIMSNDASPAEVAAGDQLQQQALMDAMRFVYLNLVGNAAHEAGNEGLTTRYQIERMTWFLQLGKIRTQAMALQLAKLFGQALYDQWGGSWAKVMEAVADPDLPLFPGGSTPQHDMPPIN